MAGPRGGLSPTWPARDLPRFPGLRGVGPGVVRGRSAGGPRRVLERPTCPGSTPGRRRTARHAPSRRACRGTVNGCRGRTVPGPTRPTTGVVISMSATCVRSGSSRSTMHRRAPCTSCWKSWPTQLTRPRHATVAAGASSSWHRTGPSWSSTTDGAPTLGAARQEPSSASRSWLRVTSRSSMRRPHRCSVTVTRAEASRSSPR